MNTKFHTILRKQNGQYLIESIGILGIFILLLIGFHQTHHSLERRKNAIEKYRNQHIQELKKKFSSTILPL